MLAPPHSLHWLLTLPCAHMPAPPHSLHLRLCLPCAHMLAPPHSLHRHFCLPCRHLPPFGVWARARFVPLPELLGLASRILSCATGGGAEADNVDLPKLPAATAHAARNSNGA